MKRFVLQYILMSNIVIINSTSSLQFLGDYVLENVEMKNGTESDGDATIGLLIRDERYQIRVSMKGGKKEGVGLVVREDGTLFMKLMFVNDICEGEVTKKNEYGITILQGRVEGGIEVGMWIEYDDNGNEIWRGLYRNGERFITVKKQEGMKGFYSEVSLTGELLSVSEYDKDVLYKEGDGFVCEKGIIVRESIYERGEEVRVLREWSKGVMIEYDKNGVMVYKGGFAGDIIKGIVREGEGTEFGSDGKSVLYVGGWRNGKREGYGSEFKGSNPVFIGEWKNGLRYGEGKELNEKGEVVRYGRWLGCSFELTRRFDDDYTNDSNVFGVDCLNGVVRLDIGNNCFRNVSQFVIDGLNELKSVTIGWKSFELNSDAKEGSKCVIMNCAHLSCIHIGDQSFLWYESFELKNLPSLISTQLGYRVFRKCRSIVFESMSE